MYSLYIKFYQQNGFGTIEIYTNLNLVMNNIFNLNFKFQQTLLKPPPYEILLNEDHINTIYELSELEDIKLKKIDEKNTNL